MCVFTDLMWSGSVNMVIEVDTYYTPVLSQIYMCRHTHNDKKIQDQRITT